MLEQIREITNVGTFYGFRPEKPIELRKLTLIYGPNGTGKTTLCAILRSLARDDPDILLGRKTLNSRGDSRVELGLAGGGRCVWDGKAWSGDRPKIEVFDEQFVRENLYTDSVEVDHRHQLLQVILGEEAAELAEQILTLTKDGEAKQSEISRREKEIDAIVGTTMQRKEFLALREDPEIDIKLEEQRKKVVAHESADRLRNERGLEPLPLPQPLEALEALLGRRFEDLSDDAEKHLLEHVERCGGKDGHRDWLERGLDYVEGDRCPFCGQSLDGVDLIRAYRTVFSQRYREHKEEIERALEELDAEFGGQASARLGEIIAKNAERARFWEAYVAADWSTVSAELVWKDDWEGYYRAVEGALQAKQQTPLERVACERVHEARERIELVLSKLREHNDSIDAINRKIEEVRRSARSDEIESARKELLRLELVKKRYEKDVVKLCDDYRRFAQEKKNIEGKKRTLQKKLEDLSESTLAACKDRVNDLLKRFNAGFVLHEMKREQARGKVAAFWTIAIRDTPIDVAKNATPREPSFKNTLSAGDRSALAFAFFLGQLEQKQDLGERIVVLDDPFTSQDSFRRRRTIKAIMEVSQKVGQCLVMSHDVQFLRDIERITAGTGYLATLDLYEAETVGAKLRPCALTFVADVTTMADYQDLELYLKKGEGKPIDIIRKIRPVLEYTFRKLFPDKVKPTDTLDSIVGKLNSLGPRVGAHAETIRDIYQYVTPYHHAEKPEDDSRPPLDPEELKRYVADTLEIVQALRNDHLKA